MEKKLNVVSFEEKVLQVKMKDYLLGDEEQFVKLSLPFDKEDYLLFYAGEDVFCEEKTIVAYLRFNNDTGVIARISIPLNIEQMIQRYKWYGAHETFEVKASFTYYE